MQLTGRDLSVERAHSRTPKLLLGGPQLISVLGRRYCA
jgi:hypothetical protein